MRPTIRLLAFFAGAAAVAGLAGHDRPLQADDVFRIASVRIPARGLRTYRAGEVIVQFKETVRDHDASDMMREAGGRSAQRSAFGPRYLVQLDTGIAYEDFGPYRKAPDFGGTVFIQGHDFINNDDHANDDNFHGTHVASTIAEATDNNVGVAGLAFGCALMPVKVLDADGVGSFFIVSEGIDYAVNFTQNGQHPVKVINLSLGGDSTSMSVQQAVDRAVAAGITVVAAAGNDGVGKISFPASLSNVIGVGAVDGRKMKAPYSNFGPELSVVAPGGDIHRDDTGPDGVPDGRPDGVLQQTFDPDTAAELGRYDDFHYFFVVGTSQATPHVAALAALLYRQGITQPAAIKAAIENSADDLGTPGRDDTYGHGLINPVTALKGYGLNQ